MNLTINNSDNIEKFVTIFQNIKLFCDMFDIEINKEKLYIQGMDPNHISIFEINLDRKWFDVYEITDNVLLGINSNIFSKILSTWTPNHNVKLSLSTNDDDKLDISFEKISGDSEYNKYFEIPLVELTTERLQIPEKQYTLDLEFDSKKFKKIVDELSIIGERVNFNANEKEINAIANSLEGNMTINIPFDDIEEYSIEEDESIETTYILKYIKNICQFSKLSSFIKIHISNNEPILLRYQLSEDSLIRFYVAPTIDDN